MRLKYHCLSQVARYANVIYYLRYYPFPENKLANPPKYYRSHDQPIPGSQFKRDRSED